MWCSLKKKKISCSSVNLLILKSISGLKTAVHIIDVQVGWTKSQASRRQNKRYCLYAMCKALCSHLQYKFYPVSARNCCTKPVAYLFYLFLYIFIFYIIIFYTIFYNCNWLRVLEKKHLKLFPRTLQFASWLVREGMQVPVPACIRSRHIHALCLSLLQVWGQLWRGRGWALGCWWAAMHVKQITEMQQGEAADHSAFIAGGTAAEDSSDRII